MRTLNVSGLTKGSALLARWMRSEGITQTVIASEHGIPQYTVSRWLRGVYPPSAAYAARLEAITGGKVPAGAWDEPPTGAQIRTHADVLVELLLRSFQRTSTPRKRARGRRAA